jgi:hypothetical protein
MPLKVLASHNVLAYDPKTRVASLTMPRLTLEQKATVRSGEVDDQR